MKHGREVSIHQLIGKVKYGNQVVFASRGNSPTLAFQILLVGALGLGVGLAGLCWSLRGGYFWVPLSFDQEKSSTESLITVAGLQNLGNNCFLNSILQSLASARCFLPFLQNLLVMEDVGDKQKAQTLPLVVSLTSLLEELCLVRDEKTVVNPRRVMLAMAQYVQGFNLTRQQDAAEAFIHLLSTLEKEITEYYIHLQHGGSLKVITTFNSRIYDQEKGASNEFEKWKKVFIGPFDGILGSYLTCQNCSSMLSVDLEFFRSLPLSPVLDERAEIVTIERLSNCVKLDPCDCRNLLRDEDISWTGISHALKKLSIIKFPKVLSFHLQRASMNCHGEFIKLQGHISFPLFLDLSSFTEVATNFEPLNSVKHKHNNLKLHDSAFIPSIGHLLMQQNLPMLPYLYNITDDKPSKISLPESKFKVPSGELLASKLADTREKAVVSGFQTRTVQERGCTEKVECSSPTSSKSCMYCLCSVVEHYGRPGSGHYAVYRKLQSQLSSSVNFEPSDLMNGSWVYISDSKVKCVGEEDVLTAEASILFYEKVEICR